MSAYRQRGDRAIRPTTAPDGSLLRVDVSGASGGDALPGANGSAGHGAGASGGNGGNAGPAQPGQPAGAIEVTLLNEPGAPNIVSVEGRVRRAGQRPEPLTRAIEIGDLGFIDIVARGGHGGAGGRGGDGGPGARGRRGSDATRFSSGSDGGPGGNGGDGGCGSSGAPGGQGGTIVLQVAETDTPLLMLVRSGVDGGPGGKAGVNGRGGAGGAGGPGGSSYSWTESETYTDSNGNTQSRTTYHSNPGGSRGPSGFDGRSATCPLKAGADGSSGQFSIVVPNGTQAGTYTTRFELRLIDFEHASENHDGVYEPGELVTLSNVSLRNVGGMPTPAHADVNVSLVANRWVDPDPQELTLPRPLWTGEGHRFETSHLRFRVGRFQALAPGDALQECARILLRGHVPRVRREFSTFYADAPKQLGEFVVRYPVQAGPIETLYSLAPGEAAHLSFRIENISQLDLGAESSSTRRVRVRLSQSESELGLGDAAFFDHQDCEVSLEPGFERELLTLPAGQGVDISGTIAIREHAPHYHCLRLLVTLDLADIEGSGELHSVQYREFLLRVSQRYRPDPDAELILVVGNRTTRDELDAWRELAQQFGAKVCVYDLSLEAGFDLEKPRDDGTPLLDDVQGKTVLVLNTSVDTSEGPVPLHQMLDKSQLHLAWRSRTHFAFVGERPKLEPLLIPSAPIKSQPQALPSLASYATEGPQHTDEPDDSGRLLESTAPQAPGSPSSPELGAFEVSRWLWPFQRGTEEHLARIARRLQRRLDKHFPNRRYVVNYEFSPSPAKGFLWNKRCDLGRLEVRRTLDSATGALVSLEATDEDLHDAGFVRGAGCTMLLLLAASFEHKLRRWRHVLKKPTTAKKELLELCARALLVDLANEQVACCQRGWSTASIEQVTERLPLLSKLTRDAVPSPLPIDPESEIGRSLIGILAAVLVLAGARIRWWEWIPPFFWLRRAMALRRATARSIDTCLEHAFVASDSEADKLNLKAANTALKAELRRHREDWKAQKDELFGTRRYDWWLGHLQAPIEGETIETDAELLLDAEQRVLDSETFDKIQKRDRRLAKKRKRLTSSAQSGRHSLRRDESCAQLIAKNRPQA